ncbi:hypothetical protein M901_1766 [Bacteriovorax sp. DB6_IX]|nr:hypothetical protein M901_1766 [Bacteriovorax sp. DB6_IX]
MVKKNATQVEWHGWGNQKIDDDLCHHSYFFIKQFSCQYFIF